jgi:DNA-binding NarL/FixJ family response regulator
VAQALLDWGTPAVRPDWPFSVSPRGLKGHNVEVPVRVLVVEDDDFARVTVAGALKSEGFDVVDSVAGVEAAIDLARVRELDVAVLDLDLGIGPTGIDLAYGLRKLQPAIGIVILTSFSDPRLLTSSLRQPPSSSVYVVKQSLTDIGLLSAAVEGCGNAAIPDLKHADVPLTAPQIETLRLLAYGLSNAEIARVRVVTEKSVEQSIARAAKRLGIQTQGTGNQRVALAREYFRLTGAQRHTHVHR